MNFLLIAFKPILRYDGVHRASPIQKMNDVSFARRIFHRRCSRKLISDEEHHRSENACRNYEMRDGTTPLHLADRSHYWYEAVAYGGSHQSTWFDRDITAAISDNVNVPVIASGRGEGGLDRFCDEFVEEEGIFPS
jgi:hypothetical protein